MIQKNSTNAAKLTFSIPTENWWIDGMDGQNHTSSLTDRFNAEEPVAYTDGGWAEGTKKAVGLKYWVDPYDGPIYMITYTDGVEDEVVFEDQTYKGRIDKPTPAFQGTPDRYGYAFAGWDPAVEEIPSKDTVYTAQWTPLTPYTVTYTDGVENEEVFPDQVYNTFDTYATPAFAGTPAREHYIFTGWTPVLADTVTETVTYVATWRVAETYTVTYTDGVEEEEVFPDQVYQVEEQQPTPAYTFDGNRPGYYFASWTPTVATVVTGDATYTANWTVCTHSSWGTPVFDEEKLTNTYTCPKCGQVKVVAIVAEIAGTRYETLQAALTSQARTKGDVTVKLLADTTECVTMTWYQQSTGQNLTIDLNGHTITGTGSASVLKFTRSGTSTSYKWNIIIDDTSADKTGTITGGKGASGGGAITVSNVKTNDSLTINGGNFTNNSATGKRRCRLNKYLRITRSTGGNSNAVLRLRLQTGSRICCRGFGIRRLTLSKDSVVVGRCITCFHNQPLHLVDILGGHRNTYRRIRNFDNLPLYIRQKRGIVIGIIRTGILRTGILIRDRGHRLIIRAGYHTRKHKERKQLF